MNFKKLFELLIPEFQKGKIDFALIGALALHFSGVTRETVDIDFVVLLNQSEKLNEIMQKYGYQAQQRNENVANYFPLYPGLPQIDFLFAHRKYALEMLKRRKV